MYSAKQSIRDLLEQILSSRRITRAAQQQFMSALLAKDSLNLEERNQINRIYEQLQLGLIRVVD